MPSTPRPSPTGLYVLLGVWLLVALGIGATGALGTLALPPPIFVVAFAGALLLAIRFSPSLRASVSRRYAPR